MLSTVFTAALFGGSGPRALLFYACFGDVRLGERLDALNAHGHGVQQTLFMALRETKARRRGGACLAFEALKHEQAPVVLADIHVAVVPHSDVR